MPESENLNELRSKYEGAVVGELSRIATDLRTTIQKVDDIKYILAQTNLAELRSDVRAVKEDLTRYNLKELSDRVDKHDTQITRAVAILVFLQIAIGLFAALARFFFQG